MVVGSVENEDSPWPHSDLLEAISIDYNAGLASMGNCTRNAREAGLASKGDKPAPPLDDPRSWF